MSERDEAQGARSAATETYRVDRRGSEHRATQRFARAANYSAFPYRGKGGWLTCKLISVEALGNREQHVLVTAATHDGQALVAQDPEKLFRLPATTRDPGLFSAPDAALLGDVEARKLSLLRDSNQRNLVFLNRTGGAKARCLGR